MVRCEDVAWASVVKKKGRDEATGSRCLACALTAKRAYPHMAWAEVLARAKSTPAFAEEVKAARRRHLAQVTPEDVQWLPESLVDERRVGYKVTQKYMAVTVDEFQRDVGKPEKFGSLKDSWMEIRDEHGRERRMLLLKHPSEPYRTVSFEASTSLELDQTIGRPSDMLRPGQHQDLLKLLPTQKPPEKILSIDELRQQADEAKEAERQAQEAAAQVDRPPLGPGLQSMQAEATLAEEPEIVEDRLQSSRTAADLALARRAGGEASTGRTKSSKNDVKKPRQVSSSGRNSAGVASKPACRSTASVAASVDDAASMVSSQTLGSKRKFSVFLSPKSKAKAKTLVQAKKYSDKLDAVQALQGSSMKWPLYQARRVYEQMTDKHSEVAINLQGHMMLIEACEQLQSLHELSPEQRRPLLEQVLASETPIPTEFRVALVLQKVRENRLASPDDIHDWVQSVAPFKVGGEGACPCRIYTAVP